MQKLLGAAGDVGFKQAMQLKWVAIDKGSGEPRVVRKAGSILDRTLQLLEGIAAAAAGGGGGGTPQGGAAATEAELAALRKRRLIKLESWTTFWLRQGPRFALERKKAATDLTIEMLKT